MTEKEENNQMNEPEASYNNSIKITTLQKLEEETLVGLKQHKHKTCKQ